MNNSETGKPPPPPAESADGRECENPNCARGDGGARARLPKNANRNKQFCCDACRLAAKRIQQRGSDSARTPEPRAPTGESLAECQTAAAAMVNVAESFGRALWGESGKMLASDRDNCARALTDYYLARGMKKMPPEVAVATAFAGYALPRIAGEPEPEKATEKNRAPFKKFWRGITGGAAKILKRKEKPAATDEAGEGENDG